MPPKAPSNTTAARSVLEALAYMAAGAWAWQVGVWVYKGLREPEAPAAELESEPEVAALPPAPPSRPPGPGGRRLPPVVKPPARLTDKPKATGGDSVSDRFSMLEIEDTSGGDDD